MDKTLQTAINACLSLGEMGVSVAAAVRAAFAGIRPAKREERRKALYDGIRAKAGVNPQTKALWSATELKTKNPSVSKAYVAARKEYSDLFPSKKTKATKKKKNGKAIVVPMTPKGVAAMAKAAIAAIQKMESPQFDAVRVVAAWQALADAAQPKK